VVGGQWQIEMQHCEICGTWFQSNDPFTRMIGDDRVCLKCEGRAERDEENESLKAEITRLTTAISALSQWRYERAAELHDAAAWGESVGQWCLETVKGGE
jgi:hypothetical protein